MKRTKHHNKRRLPAAMLIQCLWRMEVGRRDAKTKLAKIKENRKSTSHVENGVTPNGRLYALEEEDRAKTMLGAMYSLRRLKYLACRFLIKECKKRKLIQLIFQEGFQGNNETIWRKRCGWSIWSRAGKSCLNIKSTSKYKFIHSLYTDVWRERCSWSILLYLTICLRRWSWQLLWSSWRKRYFISNFCKLLYL